MTARRAHSPTAQGQDCARGRVRQPDTPQPTGGTITTALAAIIDLIKYLVGAGLIAAFIYGLFFHTRTNK